MRIAIIGSGGREHAICQKIYASKKISKIFCIPGNGGTSNIAENIEIDLNNFEKIKSFLIDKNIDITIVGPEEPLVKGIVDFLSLHKLKVFGPDKFCSKLEGSKIFTKKICECEKIPTADFKILYDTPSSLNYLKTKKYPLVVKADGLAAGKGVYVCESFLDAKKAVLEIFGGKFGKAKEILIEDFLKGEEMSFFILYDNNTFQVFNTAQDHKRVFEDDKGPNTGGMGCYSPSRLINEEMNKKVLNQIINPTISALKDLGTSYKGFLYAGLMIVKNNPYLIEYNVRMGDPECQTILPLLESDFLDLIDSCCNEKLSEFEIKWRDKKSLCIVLCSKGYPAKYKNNLEIADIEKVNTSENNFIFHAGTKYVDKKYFSNGGRVLNFVSISKDFGESRKNIFHNLNKLNWNDGFFRKDIGFKVIK